MMDLRSRPGEILDEVSVLGRSFVIERNDQQRAFLVPISTFVPDIEPSRLLKELDSLVLEDEKFRISITEKQEIQLLFQEQSGEDSIAVRVTLPHGYPNKSPTVAADPIDQSSPHRWSDGSLCIYGAMDTWNPGTQNVVNMLKLCRRWLANYDSWRKTNEWPEQRST